MDPTNPERVYALGVESDALDRRRRRTSPRSRPARTSTSTRSGSIPPNPNRIYLGNDGGFFSTHDGRARQLDQVRRPARSPSSTPARSIPRIRRGCWAARRTTTRCCTTGLADGLEHDPGRRRLLVPGRSDRARRRSSPSARTAAAATGPAPLDQRRRVLRRADRASSAPTATTGCTPFVMNPDEPQHRCWSAASASTGAPTTASATRAISGDLDHQPADAARLRHDHDARRSRPPDTSIYYAGTDDGRVWRSINAGACGPTSRPGCRCAG